MPVSFAVLECESEGQKSPRGAPDRRLKKELTWCRCGAPPPRLSGGNFRREGTASPGRQKRGAGTKELG